MTVFQGASTAAWPARRRTDRGHGTGPRAPARGKPDLAAALGEHAGADRLADLRATNAASLSAAAADRGLDLVAGTAANPAARRSGRDALQALPDHVAHARRHHARPRFDAGPSSPAAAHLFHEQDCLVLSKCRLDLGASSPARWRADARRSSIEPGRQKWSLAPEAGNISLASDTGGLDVATVATSSTRSERSSRASAYSSNATTGRGVQVVETSTIPVGSAARRTNATTVRTTKRASSGGRRHGASRQAFAKFGHQSTTSAAPSPALPARRFVMRCGQPTRTSIQVQSRGAPRLPGSTPQAGSPRPPRRLKLVAEAGLASQARPSAERSSPPQTASSSAQ